MALFSQVEIFAPGEELPPAGVSPGEVPAGHPPERPAQPPCPR
jgi:hypothetical protein